MDAFLNPIRTAVKKVMRQIAAALNALTGGRLTPNTITIVGLIAHLPIVWLIVNGYLMVAGLWLIIFGLFDTLDGELARLQKRASPAGMFLDSVTDRIKEVMIYAGIVSYFAGGLGIDFNGSPYYYGKSFDIYPGLLLPIILAVLGGSMLTSYINAWGEAVLGRTGAKNANMNKAFRGGLGSFEVRMTLLVAGLLTGYLFEAVLLIGVFVGLTIIERLFKVFRELNRVQS